MNTRNTGRATAAPYSTFAVGRLPQIHFGPGRIGDVAELIAGYGNRIALVTGESSFAASRRLQSLLSELDQRDICREHVVIPGEPTPEMIDAAVRRLRADPPAAVLAVGGGSALDAGKAIAGLTPGGAPVTDYLEGVGSGRVYRGPALPMVAVPTTAGTGSEATRNAVIGRAGRGGFKKSFRDNALVPRHAVIDPDLLASCPAPVIAANGMDALTQLLESYLSTRASRFTDALARSGLESIRDGLESLYRSEGADAAARERMAWAALASGICLAQSGLGSVHGLAAPLGALFPIPHGVACGAVVAEATAINVAAAGRVESGDRILRRYAEVAALLCGTPVDDRDAAAALVDWLRQLTRRLGVPGLSAYGVTDADVAELVANSRGNSMRTNPVELTDDEIANLVRRCL